MLMPPGIINADEFLCLFFFIVNRYPHKGNNIMKTCWYTRSNITAQYKMLTFERYEYLRAIKNKITVRNIEEEL